MVFDKRLLHHLATWLGQWPAGRALAVVASSRRDQPAWDGRTHPVLGVGDPAGTVVSVAPASARTVRGAGPLPVADLLDRLPALVGLPDRPLYRAVFRYTAAPTPLGDAGDWISARHPAVPPWLHPFGGEVLVARDDDGRYLAGVGVKRHDAFGHELAVGTEPAARGRGLARRLVAQAARRVLDEGAVPTYLHDTGNHASARVAAAAGFPDRGWSAYAIPPG